MVKTCELGVCENDPKYPDTPVIPPLPEDGGGGGGGGDGHKYTFRTTATGWEVLEDGKVIYRYTDKDTNTTYSWQATDEGWLVKDNTGKVVFTYTDKSGKNTTYSFEKKDDCGFKVTDSDGVVVFDYDNDCAGTTYTYEQTGVDFKVTDNNTGQVVFTYKGTTDTNTTYNFENYKDGFKVTDSDGVVAYVYDPNLGKDSDGSYAIDTLLTPVFKGHTTISTGQIVGFTPANLVVGETLVYDGVGSVGVITADNGDGTYQVTTMTTSPGSRQGVRLGSVNTVADLPATCAAAEALGWQTPQLGDFAYVTTGGAGDVISEYVITSDTDCNLTWTFSHSFNAGDYQEQSTTSMAGMILTGGAVQGTFGTPIDPSTLIRGVMRNGILLTPDAQGKVNVIVDDSHIIVNALPTANIVDKAEYVVIDANQKVTGTWVHDNTGWYQTYAAVTQVKAHQVVTALPTTNIEENVEYVVVDDQNKVTGTWVYDPAKGWLQTEVLDKPAHIVVKDLPTTDIDDEAEYIVVDDLTDPVGTFNATYVHTDSGWVKTAEAAKAQAAHIAVTALPTTNINENAEYLVMTDLTDPTTLTGTWVRVNGNWVQTEKIDDNGFHIVKDLPTSDIDDKNIYIVVEDLANPDTSFLGQYAYDKATSKWVDMTPQVSNIYYNINRTGEELSSWAGQFAAHTYNSLASTTMPIKEVSVGKGNKIKFNSGTNSFTLAPNTRYEVLTTMAAKETNANLYYNLRNITDSVNIDQVQWVDQESAQYPASGSMVAQFTTPDHPIEVDFRAAIGSQNATTTTREPFCSIAIKEIGRVVDPIAYMLNDGDAQEMPVGSLIQTMSNSAPKHYLICDGSEYAIGTYPELEAHFVKEFGAVDHFGGTSGKWKVPDLRGEFLRMTGTNSHINTITGLKEGNGADVGAHQEASVLPQSWSGTGANVAPINYTENMKKSADTLKPFSKVGTNGWSTTNTYGGTAGAQTVRPTNTSVNVAIKCESTPRVIVDQGTYKASVKCSVPAAPSSGSAQFRFDGSDIIGDTTMVDTTTNEFVAPVDGLYVVGCQTTTSGTGVVSNYLSINGANTCWGRGINPMGTVYLKTGDRVSLNMYGGSSAQTGRANIALVNTVEKNIAEVMLKPNTWAVGVEQNFGDGVYGMRVSGTFSSSTSQDNLAQLGAGAKPISSGGSVSNASTSWSLPFVNSNSAITAQSIGVFTSSTGGLCVRIGSDMYKGKYDIWCLYTK